MSLVLRPALLALSILLGLAALPARAVEPLAILLEQLDARIALSEAMEKEGVRQAEERIGELEQWIGWWESVRALVEAKQTDLTETLEKRAENAELMLNLVRGLVSDPKQERQIPNYGAVTLETAVALQTSILLEVRQLREAIAEGKDNWHIVAIGWITGGQVQGRIDVLDQEIETIRAGIASGEYLFHSAFGWQKIGIHRTAAEDQRAERKRILCEIEDGTFPLEIPGLGRLTRRDLEARLADVEAQIDALKTQGAEGTFGIFRPAVDWVNRNDLVKRLEETDSSYATAEALLTQGLFTVHVAGVVGGHVTQKNLQDRIDAMDKTIEEVTVAIRAGDYGANVMGGYHSLNQLANILQDRERRIGDPNLTQLQRNQLAEQIEAVHKAMKEWRDISAFDLTIKALDKTQYLAWVGWVMKLARPDFDARTIRRAEMAYHLGSFDGELALRLRPLETQRDALLAARAWFAAP